MFRALLVLALALGMSSCAWFQGDEEELEVSNEANTTDNVGDNFANQELTIGQEEDLGNNTASFDNQIGGEDSSVATENPLLNDEGVNTEANVPAAPDMDAGMMGDAGMMSGEGAVVRYTMGETNVYEQPDASSNPVRTLGQGEVLLVTIGGEFAQSSFGFIAVADLSAELQPRVFVGNDWQ